jgi:rod shape-determining protein MreD
MATFVAIPILTCLMILQGSILSRIPLLRGTPDLLLLALVGWALQKRVQTAWQWCIIASILFTLVSALPLGAALVGYVLATGIALLLRRQVWQVPVLALFVAVLLGTLASQGVSLAALRLVGDPLPLLQSFNLVVLPSALLNLLFAIPAYALLGDLANWLYPEELEA